MPNTPSIMSSKSTPEEFSEQKGSVCPMHGDLQNPHLEKILKSRTKSQVQELTTALNDLADEDRCTSCAVQNLTSLVMGYVQEIRVAKKNGAWSKEEKKALKKEVKGLAKSVKADFKSQKAGTNKDLGLPREQPVI